MLTSNSTGHGYIDCTIFANGRPVAIIENKTEAPLTKAQLKKYDRDLAYKGAKRIALVKYRDVFEYGSWKIIAWSDFFKALEKAAGRKSIVAADRRQIEDLLEHIKEMGMAKVTRISKADLQHLAKTIYYIRADSRQFDAKGFDIGSNFRSILFDLRDVANADKTDCPALSVGKEPMGS